MSEPLLIGVDGGGTSTAAWLADARGVVLGRGLAGPSNAKTVGAATALAALDQAIARAFDDAQVPPRTAAVACLGLAGFGRPEDQQRLRDWADRTGAANRIVTVTDGDLIVAAGTSDGWGIGVIAGTGSIAVGRDPRGKTARAGGWGPLMGDEGSAYWVVLAALRRVMRRADGRAPGDAQHDPLTRELCTALGTGDPAALVPIMYAPAMDRTKIAALAPLVIAAAREDPSVVAEILEPAGRELAEAALAVARSLELGREPLPLALSGGFLLGSAEVSSSLLAHLESAGYRTIPTFVADPVQGAVILATKALTASDH